MLEPYARYVNLSVIGFHQDLQVPVNILLYFIWRQGPDRAQPVDRSLDIPGLERFSIKLGKRAICFGQYPLPRHAGSEGPSSFT